MKKILIIIAVELLLIITGCSPNAKVNEPEKEIETCLEGQLGAYVTTERISPNPVSLKNIIKVDLDDVDYHKFKVTENGWSFAIIKTNNNDIIQNLENYFKKNYSGYKSTLFNDEYYIYVYNGHDDFNLDEDLAICNK